MVRLLSWIDEWTDNGYIELALVVYSSPQFFVIAISSWLHMFFLMVFSVLIAFCLWRVYICHTIHTFIFMRNCNESLLLYSQQYATTHWHLHVFVYDMNYDYLLNGRHIQINTIGFFVSLTRLFHHCWLGSRYVFVYYFPSIAQREL